MASLDTFFGDDADVILDRNFQLLILANVLAVLGTVLISPLLSSLTGPFEVSETRIGLMVSVFTAPAIFVIPLAGVLADRYGRKPVLVASLLLFGTTGTGIALTTDFRVVLALRFLQGLAFAGLPPVIITILGDLYDGVQETTAQGLRSTVSGVSMTAFPLIASLLVVIGWQYPFLLYSFSIPVALLIYLGLNEPTSDVQGNDDDSCGTLHGRSHVHRLFHLVSRRRILAILLARGMPEALWIGFLTYNSIIMVRVIGGTPQQAGILVSINSIMFAAAASQAGRVQAAFSGWFAPLIGATICLTGGLSLVALAPSVLLASVGSAILGSGFGMSLALYRSVITGLTHQTLRGSLVSLGESFGRFTATLTPLLMGMIISISEPVLGFSRAVRLTNSGLAVVGGFIAIVCLLTARATREADYDQK